MRSKQILSFLREGDFAHPGEVSAIDLIMEKIPKNSDRFILDIGCGLGGTSHYLQTKGFGKVTGIDIDADLISQASKKYYDSQFINCNVMNISHQISQKFQLMICMSAFFCFSDQKQALVELSKIVDKNTELVIFDYSRLISDHIESPFYWSETASRFYPIYLTEFKKTLSESGWQYQSSIDITDKFELWYLELLNRFESKKEEMNAIFDKKHVSEMEDGYKQLLLLIREKKVGGIVVYATCQSDASP